MSAAWGDQILDAAATRARGELAGPELEAALAGVEAFRPIAPALERQGREQVGQVLELLQGGQLDAARLAWLRDEATEAEVWDTADQAGQAAREDLERRRAEWESLLAAVREAALAVGSAGLGIVFRLLVGALAGGVA